MGDQVFTSRTLNDTVNPKWNFNCQFHIRDVYQDVLCITIYERDPFAPDGQSSVCFCPHFVKNVLIIKYHIFAYSYLFVCVYTQFQPFTSRGHRSF